MDHRPDTDVIINSGVVVVQALTDYEEETGQRAFIQAVVRGMMDLEEGRKISLREAKKRLGLK